MNQASNKLLKFYGELSLRDWISLLLNQKIKLPEYQRKFVWDPSKVIELYRSLIEGTYIPPILIAHKTSKEFNGDYILDGQQRLSAILLLYFGVYPNFKTDGKTLNDMLDAENDEFYIDWTINKIFEKNDINIENIVDAKNRMIKTGLYKDIKDETLYGSMFKNMSEIINNIDFGKILFKCSIGYSYIKYEIPDSLSENKGFAKIFRNINSNGIILSGAESRRALYWACEDTEKFDRFFEPEELKNIYIENKKMDLESLLSYVAERANGEIKFAINRRSDERRQEYYNEYLETVITDEDSNIFGKFSSIVNNREFLINKVIDYCKENIEPFRNGKFDNIMQAQIYLFGLLYWIIYKNKDIDYKDEINQSIKEYIKTHQDYTKYRNITEIRDRMEKSIKIYEKGIKENE